MTRMTIAALTLGLLIAVPSVGQVLNDAQQEVWEFELSCLQMTDADIYLEECFHDDYVGWWTEDPVPMSKDGVRRVIESDPETFVNSSFVSAWPVSITLHDNVAVVHYFSQWSVLDEDGNRTTEWNRWTDIAMQSDGRWQWIADAGNGASEPPGESEDEP